MFQVSNKQFKNSVFMIVMIIYRCCCFIGRARVRIPDNINVVEGEKLKIVCNVVGNPPPSITWKVCKYFVYLIVE